MRSPGGPAPAASVPQHSNRGAARTGGSPAHGMAALARRGAERLLRLIGGRGRRLLRLVGGGIGGLLRLVEGSVHGRPAALDGGGRLAAQVLQLGLGLALPLGEALLELRAGHIATLRGEEQAERRADRTTPYERADGLHLCRTLLVSSQTSLPMVRLTRPSSLASLMPAPPALTFAMVRDGTGTLPEAPGMRRSARSVQRYTQSFQKIVRYARLIPDGKPLRWTVRIGPAGDEEAALMREVLVRRGLGLGVEGVMRLDAIQRDLVEQHTEEVGRVVLDLAAAAARMRQQRDRAASVRRVHHAPDGRAGDAIAGVRDDGERGRHVGRVSVRVEQRGVVYGAAGDARGGRQDIALAREAIPPAQELAVDRSRIVEHGLLRLADERAQRPLDRHRGEAQDVRQPAVPVGGRLDTGDDEDAPFGAERAELVVGVYGVVVGDRHDAKPA